MEPFSYESVKAYEKEKTNLAITESGRIITDPEEDSLPTVDNALLNAGNKTPMTVRKKNLFLLTGEKGLGKDEWACVLAASTAQAKKPTIILDYARTVQLQASSVARWLNTRV
ncbi:MAG: hypothetical protein ACLR6B_04080 [Blautia sp.]